MGGGATRLLACAVGVPLGLGRGVGQGKGAGWRNGADGQQAERLDVLDILVKKLCDVFTRNSERERRFYALLPSNRRLSFVLRHLSSCETCPTLSRKTIFRASKGKGWHCEKACSATRNEEIGVWNGVFGTQRVEYQTVG